MESKIKEFKKHHHRMMALHRCPDAFWDYGWVYTRDIRKFLVRNASHGQLPCETIGNGRPVDISEFMDYDFY